MLTTFDSPDPVGPIRGDAVVLTPQGPKGLWGALASVSAPTIGDRALPLADTSLMGLGGSMFDYDAEQAVDLGFDLDELLAGDPSAG